MAGSTELLAGQHFEQQNFQKLTNDPKLAGPEHLLFGLWWTLTDDLSELLTQKAGILASLEFRWF